MFSNPGTDPAVIIASEWKQMGMFRRMAVRWASPDLARSAKYLADHGVAYASVPVVGKATDGPVTRWADRMFTGSSR